VWRHGKLDAEEMNLDDLDTFLAAPDTLVWLDLCEPGPEHLTALAHELGLDAHAVEDALAHKERPKATRHATHTFVTAYATRLIGGSEGAALGDHASRLVLTRLSAFILPRALITVRTSDDFDMDEVVQRWDDNADLLTAANGSGVGVLLHGLLDVIVDGHFETIEALDDAIEDIEGLLFDEQVSTRSVQQRVYRMRKELVELRRVVLPMREVVNTVLRHRSELREAGRGSAELDGYYDDLYDHVLRAAEWTESLRDMVSTLFETNLSLQDSHLNTVMKKLAGWGAIIAVPTAVTGWYGQNIPYPGFQEAPGLWQSAILVVVCSSGLYAYLKVRDWI
jgi:magnesium transporter